MSRSAVPDDRVEVFDIFTIGFDQTRTPTRLAVSVFPTDRNVFVVNAGEASS